MQNKQTNRFARRNCTLRNASPFERLENRQLMSATSVKAVDSGGPDFAMVESGGNVYVLSSSANGAGQNQIWVTTGSTKTSKLLVDAKTDSKVSSLDNLTVTGDGRVLFTANSATGGRQIFQITSKGYTQLTKASGVYFNQLQAVGSKVYAYDSQHTQIDSIDSKGVVKKVATGQVAHMYAAKEQLFYTLAGDGGLFRSDGTTAGTYKVNGNLTFGTKVFGSNDWIYFVGSANNNTSLYRTDGSTSAPVKIADDFSLFDFNAVENGDSIYFGGSYYNTSPHAAGSQLYRVVSRTGEITQVTNQIQSNGGASVDGVDSVGTNIYFVSNDGDFLSSEGTYDRELFRYSTVTGQTTQVTNSETLYPVSIGGGVLSSYYFVAAPTKVGSRFGGVRYLYRTNPTDDSIEKVAGEPSYTSGGKTQNDVDIVFASSKGLFYSARNNDGTGGDYDTYFVQTPFSFIDPATHKLTIQGTANNDNLQIKVVGNNLSMTLNGQTETQALSSFNKIDVYLGAGDDTLVTSSNVAADMGVFADAGDDKLTTGSGNDYILTGAGKNLVHAGAGDDKVKGAAGQDKLYGDDGEDLLYGRAGSDFLDGGNGSDQLRGDDKSGPYGNDTLNGGSSNDRLYGFGGNDVLNGGKQNDYLFAGDGNDTVNGNEGDDQIDGGIGANQLFGNDGNDAIVANYSSLDLIDGGNGTDSVKKDASESKVFSIETIV